MMRNQRKIVEKMTEDLNYYVFRGPKWLGNWSSEADIQHPSKSSPNWHVNQDWCETSGIFFFWRWPNGRNFYLFGGSRWSKNLASDAHILHTYKSTCNGHVKQEEFWLIWGPKNWAFEAHIVHITESSCNGHKKQGWCEFKGNFLMK